MRDLGLAPFDVCQHCGAVDYHQRGLDGRCVCYLCGYCGPLGVHGWNLCTTPSPRVGHCACVSSANQA